MSSSYKFVHFGESRKLLRARLIKPVVYKISARPHIAFQEAKFIVGRNLVLIILCFRNFSSLHGV
ncbi:hypothetical protein E2C01_043527 [Portunus trituberculatus]|uniref:Uncharacterized protein n=1 Tax=Portunus trituberculatus TaxID=210409 RepID=A0A5B7FWL6_PORTR|nr:hypothetical protein [Portunus trituberculatus]